MRTAGPWLLPRYRLVREPSTQRITFWLTVKRLGAALDGLYEDRWRSLMLRREPA